MKKKHFLYNFMFFYFIFNHILYAFIPEEGEFYYLVNKYHFNRNQNAFLDGDSASDRIYGSRFHSDNTKWRFEKTDSPGFYRLVNKYHFDRSRNAFLDGDSASDRIHGSGFYSDNTKWKFIKVQEQPSFHPPFIQVDQGTFNVNNIYEDILNLMHTSYAIAKAHKPKKQYDKDECNEDELERKGWPNLKIFGTTGNLICSEGLFEDIPGIVHYNKEKNVIAIVFHGSCNGGDWLTNFNPAPKKARKIGLNFEGKYHRGFLYKYKELQENLETALHFIFDRIGQEKKEKLQLIVSGHSQGAALAHIASIDLVQNFLQKRYKNFENEKLNDNQLKLVG